MKQLSVMENQIMKVNKFFTIPGSCVVLILDKAYLITGNYFRETPEWITGNCLLYISTYQKDMDGDLLNNIHVQENSDLYFIGKKMFELTKDELNDYIVQHFI